MHSECKEQSLTHECKKSKDNNFVLIKQLTYTDEQTPEEQASEEQLPEEQSTTCYQYWALVYKSYAGEQEVNSGEANYVGEFQYGVTIAIDFCPFCGTKLET